MKIAVQFYGHLRTFEKTYKSVQDNLLTNYDCDVFIHTWDELQHRTKTWYDQGQNHMPVDENCVKKIHEFYNPKRLLIEKQEIPEEDTILQSHIISDSVMSLTGLKYLMYSQYTVNELRKEYQKDNNVSYDYVITIRPDVILLKPLILEKFIEQQSFLNPSHDIRFCAYNASGDSNATILLKSTRATDILYFSNPEVMDKHVSLYEKIKNDDQYLIDNFSTVEGLYYTHNRSNNIEMSLISFVVEKDWNVVRFTPSDNKQKKKHKFKRIKRIVLKNTLSILPHFIVEKKIAKLKKKIKNENK